MEFRLHDTFSALGGQRFCLLHIMVDMVVGPCLGVEDLGDAPPPYDGSGDSDGYTGIADPEPA